MQLNVYVRTCVLSACMHAFMYVHLHTHTLIFRSLRGLRISNYLLACLLSYTQKTMYACVYKCMRVYIQMCTSSMYVSLCNCMYVNILLLLHTCHRLNDVVVFLCSGSEVAMTQPRLRQPHQHCSWNCLVSEKRLAQHSTCIQSQGGAMQ